MAQRKCPACGSTNVTQVEWDYYDCDDCPAGNMYAGDMDTV